MKYEITIKKEIKKVIEKLIHGFLFVVVHGFLFVVGMLVGILLMEIFNLTP